jgi:hypothetical protein
MIAAEGTRARIHITAFSYERLQVTPCALSGRIANALLAFVALTDGD